MSLIVNICRSALPGLGGLALCASMLALGSGALLATPALACPEEANAGEGHCPCGKDKAECEAAKAAGGCGGGCEGKAHDGKDAKACACAPGEDGKCACGADCPSKHGGNCTKSGAAAPAGEKPGSCAGDKGQGASVAPSAGDAAASAHATGGRLEAVIDPVTGEFSSEPAGAAAAPSARAAGANQVQVVREVAAPGAGTMVDFPLSRVSRSVATIDANGKTQVGCQQ